MMAAVAQTIRRKAKVRLSRIGHTISIEPAVPELIMAFRTSCHEAVRHEGRVEMSRCPVRLIHIVGREMLCPAGLGEILVEMLQRLGYQLVDMGRHVDFRPRPLKNPRPLDGLMAEPFDASFLRLVETRERGLIRYDPAYVSPARLIAQVALAYPKVRIVCAVTRLDDCHSLRRELQRWLKHEPILALSHRCSHPDVRARIVVGSYATLGGGAADLHNRDVLFSLCPTEMLANICGKYTVRDADTGRLFGFLQRDKKLTESERDRCTAWFGPGELVIPRPGQIERPLEVLFLPVRGGPALPQDAGTCELLREGVWRHSVRNRRIARLADALATGNAAALKSLTTNPHTLRLLAECGSKVGVGVLCGSIEHALELCGRLRGWRLVTGPTVRITGLSPESTDLLKFARRQPSRPGKGLIVTEAGLSRIRRCNVIIRADAGVGGIPTHWTKKNTDSRYFSTAFALVIDFVDWHDPELLKRSSQRRAAYLAAGCRLSAEFPSMLDQFLATRRRLELTQC